MTARTLTEFLIARIGEDEAVARAAVVDGWIVHEYPYEGTSVTDYEREDYEGDLSAAGAHIEAHSPARVLAECESKRAIIADVAGLSGQWYDEIEYRILTDLAQIYSDHPDYREDWYA